MERKVRQHTARISILRCEGVTLIELLIALAVGTFVVLSGYSFLVGFNRNTGLEDRRTTARQEARLVIGDLRLDFQRRAATASWSLISPASSACPGLQISQTQVSSTTRDVVQYLTSCGPATVSAQSLQDRITSTPARCPTGFSPQVRIIKNNTLLRSIPQATSGFATALCFSSQVMGTDTVISAQLATIYSVGKQSGLVAEKTVLTTADRGAGIEYLHPQ